MKVTSNSSGAETAPLSGDLADVRVLEDNRRAIVDTIRVRDGEGRLAPFARLLGGLLIEGIELQASSSTSESADVVVTHALGRIPAIAILGVAVDGLGGTVYGAPSGGIGAAGGNQGPWTRSTVRLRASRTATYDVVIA